MKNKCLHLAFCKETSENLKKVTEKFLKRKKIEHKLDYTYACATRKIEEL